MCSCKSLCFNIYIYSTLKLSTNIKISKMLWQFDWSQAFEHLSLFCLRNVSFFFTHLVFYVSLLPSLHQLFDFDFVLVSLLLWALHLHILLRRAPVIAATAKLNSLKNEKRIKKIIMRKVHLLWIDPSVSFHFCIWIFRPGLTILSFHFHSFDAHFAYIS